VFVLVGVLLAGCSVFETEPTTLQQAKAAVKELRAAAGRVTSYRADFTARFDQVAYAEFDWTGSMRSTGQDWSATSDLKRSGKDWAHLDTVHQGGTRYHKQTGQQVTLAQWNSFQDARATNYFWYIGFNKGVDTPPQSLPEFDPLAYLDIDSAFQVTRTDLPGGGHRYTIDGDDWTPGGRIAATFDTFPYGRIPLVVDIGGDGRPARVEVGPFGNGQLNDITMTMTLHDLGADVTVTPPPADQIVAAR
jgi:hypothetical protein